MKLIPTLMLSNGISKMKTKASETRKGFFALVALVLFSMAANAQVTIPGTTLNTNAASPAATTSCVNGKFASGWTTAGGYWEWAVNASGYTGIQFATAISSSSTGPKNGTVWYSTDNWATGTQVGSSSYTWSTSCGSIATISLPSGADNASNLKIRLFPTGATNASGTNRVSTATIKGIASSCSSVTAGSITVTGSTAFCEGLSTTLNLVGASSGTGITYQWQYFNGSIWVAATGTNNGATYNVSGYAAGSYNFRVYVDCSGCCNATTASQTITIHANPATPVIDGSSVPSSPLTVDNWPTTTGLNLFDLNLTSGSGGSWSSNNTAFVVDDASTGVGHITAGGSGTLTYTITNFNGCTSSAAASFDAVWDNTLALYAGQNGTSTGVIVGKANATSTSLAAGTSFGTSAPCGSGGLSGKTVPNTVTAPDVNYAVYYTVAPASGSYAVNAHQIHAKIRVSATGPTKAKIGYKIGAGAWVYGSEVTLTDGSCGTSANDWYFTFTENGITSDITVGVFPYASNGGVFQINQLELYGDVTSSTACMGTPSAGYLRTQQDTICSTGDRWIELVQPGGVGITYQWQEFDGSTFVNIAGETNAFYNTGALIAPATGQYQVVVSCAGGSTATTTPISIYAVSLPVATITNDAPGNVINVGDYYDFNGSTPGIGETAKWSSNYVSTANIDVNNGDFTALFPAKNVIVTYKISSASGCYGIDKDTFDIIYDNPIAYYLGDNGNSTSIVDVQAVTSSALAATGFGAGTSCTKGGVSGLTNSPASFSTANAHVSFTFTNNNASDMAVISGIRATVRSSGAGPASLRFAYRVHDGSSWGAWIDEGTDQSVSVDDCGYSPEELFWGNSAVSTTPPSFPALFYGQTLEVAVFPFDAVNTAGTFQVNSLTVQGRVAEICGSTTQIQDASNTNVDGGALCLGTNALHLQVPADETYWLNVLPNDPSIAYFDYASISGNSTGTLEAVSIYTDAIIYAIGYKTSGSCLELNSAVVDYVVCSPKTSGINNINESEKVAFYPNPATDVVKVKANEAVNVTINSIDGKTLMQQKDAKNINISSLANGVYFIHAYDSKNVLIKTEKLIKQ
jgi:hypothetical protein